MYHNNAVICQYDIRRDLSLQAIDSISFYCPLFHNVIFACCSFLAGISTISHGIFSRPELNLFHVLVCWWMERTLKSLQTGVHHIFFPGANAQSS